jgi:hypothetical protein
MVNGRRVKLRGPLIVVAVLAGVLVTATPAHALSCGGFRWPIKTLSDADARRVDSTPRNSTVKRLRSLARPTNLQPTTPRLRPVELHTYRVTADLVVAARMPDHDIHVVIEAPTAHHKRMVVELPDVRCPGARVSPKKAAIRRARVRFEQACGRIGTSRVKIQGRVTIVGVGFWDDPNPGRNSAPNGIELHPVLSFHGSCTRT